MRLQALEMNVIDEISDNYERALRGAEIVLMAVPVAQNRTVLKKLAMYSGNGFVVSDAGSTKQDFIRIARSQFPSGIQNVIPGHPIAGSEKNGAESANSRLFVDKQVVLTPVKENDTKAIFRIRELWEACGANVMEMEPEHHDRIFGLVSHFPHLLSFGLVNLIAKQKNAEELFSFAGGGFKDFTRIASSSPEMWRDIFMANRDCLINDIEKFENALVDLKNKLRDAKAQDLELLLSDARNARNRWLKSRHEK